MNCKHYFFVTTLILIMYIAFLTNYNLLSYFKKNYSILSFFFQIWLVLSIFKYYDELQVNCWKFVNLKLVTKKKSN
ncbi:hypothetical protein CR513_49283, partial [Mucuna pruriens]